MDHGRIIERGTHRELLENQGAYAHMWTLQQQEEAERNKEGKSSHQAEAVRA
jgi:ATP-binding cassette subfamily B protein